MTGWESGRLGQRATSRTRTLNRCSEGRVFVHVMCTLPAELPGRPDPILSVSSTPCRGIKKLRHQWDENKRRFQNTSCHHKHLPHSNDKSGPDPARQNRTSRGLDLGRFLADIWPCYGLFTAQCWSGVSRIGATTFLLHVGCFLCCNRKLSGSLSSLMSK